MKIALTATPSVARFAPIVVRGEISEAFALASELEYDGVELHLRHASDVDRVIVKRLATNYGLGVPTLGTGMAAGEDGLTFVDSDPEVRRRAVERVKEHVDLAAELDSAVTIGVVSGRIGTDPEKGQALRAAGNACLDEVCRSAESVGVTILLEPLNRYECDHISTVEQGLAVIEEIGAPNLKLLADTFHENIEETDIPASLRRAGEILGHVHLVDSNREVPGHGHLDVRGVLRELVEMNYGAMYLWSAFRCRAPDRLLWMAWRPSSPSCRSYSFGSWR